MIAIRPAQLTDLDALTTLNRQIGSQHAAEAPQVFNPPSADDRRYLQKQLADPERHLLVAEQDGDVVGYICATINSNDTVPFLSFEAICRISTVVVATQHQQQGVGSALMTAMEDWARANGAVQIRLEVMAFNSEAQHFYQHLHYQTQSIIMAKPL